MKEELIWQSTKTLPDHQLRVLVRTELFVDMAYWDKHENHWVYWCSDDFGASGDVWAWAEMPNGPNAPLNLIGREQA